MSPPVAVCALSGLLFLLSGCAARADREESAGAAPSPPALMTQPDRADEPRDPPPAMNVVFQVDIYQLAVPFGTFSGNEPFWKRINEQCVDVATYDLLFRNGIRLGEAPISELPTFRRYLSDVLPAQKLTVTAMEVKNVELPIKKDLVEQTIFYFDSSNRLIGSSFDRCENTMTISFQPTPRRSGYLRMTLCPVVRSQRKLLQFTPGNEERELAYVKPERFYDLNMRVDIPRDSFLVVAPSTDAARPTSVGQAFLTADGPAERMEQVLLVVPRSSAPAVGK